MTCPLISSSPFRMLVEPQFSCQRASRTDEGREAEGAVATAAAPVEEVPSPPNCFLVQKSWILVEKVGPRQVTIEDAGDKFVLTLNPPPVRTLVLCGGGAKGLSYGRVLKALGPERLAQIKQVSGASAGAISAALIASGVPEKEFEDLTGSLDFMDLLDGQPRGDTLEDGFSHPLIRKLLEQFTDPLSMLSKLRANGTPLEVTIRITARESVLKHVQRRLGYPGLNGKQHERLQDIHDRLVRGRGDLLGRKCAKGADTFVTFGMLRELSALIPEIKALQCTAVRQEQDGPQLMIFSADTTPDVDIAVAAHASAALPVVLRAVKCPSDFDYKSRHNARMADGGSLLNLPLPGLIDVPYALSALPNPDLLILPFQYNEVPDSAGLGQKFRDVMGGSHTSGMDGMTAARLRTDELVNQTVNVPLTMPDGTTARLLDFNMRAEWRDYLQNKLEEKIAEHLVQREATPIRAEFKTLDSLLLALEPPDLEALSGQLPEASALLLQHREWDALLGKLAAQLIPNKDEILLLNETNLQATVYALDQSVRDHAHGLAYLARRINQPSTPLLQRWLNVMHDQGEEWRQAPARTALERAAMAEYDLRLLRGKVLTIQKDLIFRSQYLLWQRPENVALLQKVSGELDRANNRDGVVKALQYLCNNYLARLASDPRAPLCSWTVALAQDWIHRLQTPVPTRPQPDTEMEVTRL